MKMTIGGGGNPLNPSFIICTLRERARENRRFSLEVQIKNQTRIIRQITVIVFGCINAHLLSIVQRDGASYQCCAHFGVGSDSNAFCKKIVSYGGPPCRSIVAINQGIGPLACRDPAPIVPCNFVASCRKCRGSLTCPCYP